MKVDIIRVKLGLHPNPSILGIISVRTVLLSGKSSHIHLVELDMSISLLPLANQLTDRGFLWANHVMDGCFADQAQLVLVFFIMQNKPFHYSSCTCLQCLGLLALTCPGWLSDSSCTCLQCLGLLALTCPIVATCLQCFGILALTCPGWLSNRSCTCQQFLDLLVLTCPGRLSYSSCACLQCLGLLAPTCPGQLSDSSCTCLQCLGLLAPTCPIVATCLKCLGY
jgi:hypothetical protein